MLISEISKMNVQLITFRSKNNRAQARGEIVPLYHGSEFLVCLRVTWRLWDMLTNAASYIPSPWCSDSAGLWGLVGICIFIKPSCIIKISKNMFCRSNFEKY